MASQNGSVRLALCVVVAGTVSAWALTPHDKAVGVQAEQKANRSANAQIKTERDKDGPTPAPSLVAPSQTTGQQGNAEQHGENREQEGTEFWPTLAGYKFKITDSLIALSTLALTVFTGLLWRSTEKLWAAGERQIQLVTDGAIQQSQQAIAALDIASRNADAAKSSADFLSFQNSPVIYIQSIEFSNSKAMVNIGNSGKSMAIVQNIKFGYGIFTDIPDVPTYHHGSSAIVEIPPGSSYQFEGPFRQIVLSQHEPIRKGEIFEFLWGVIVYSGEIHEFTELGFCSRWGKGGYNPVVKDGYTYKRNHA